MKSFPIYDDREVHRRRRRRLMPNARMIHAALTALSFKRESNVLKKVFIRQQLSVYPCLRSLYEFIGCEKCRAETHFSFQGHIISKLCALIVHTVFRTF